VGGAFLVDSKGSFGSVIYESNVHSPISSKNVAIGLQPLTPIMAKFSLDAEMDASPVELRAEIKLGGCADPLFGSILDSANMKGPKMGKVEAVGYGGYGGGRRSISTDAAPFTSTLRWEVGAISECGIRESNEDAFLVVEDLAVACGTSLVMDAAAEKVGVFAIFDGHCGSQASRFAAEQFSFHLMESYREIASAAEGQNHGGASPSSEQLENALLDAMEEVDHRFCHIAKEDGRDWISGSTALVVLVSGNHVLVANLGDCRAVICASGVEQAYLDNFSYDDGWNRLEYDQQFSWSSYCNQKSCFWKEVCDIHSPSREDERRRIEAANGWITIEREVCIAQMRRVDFVDEDVVEIMTRYFSDRIDAEDEESLPRAAPGRLLEIARICGELAVSRAIGDRDLKARFNPRADVEDDGHWWTGPDFLPYPLDHNFSFKGDLVSAEPEIQVHTVGSKGVDDEFLILACDGLWDVMDPDDAVRITRSLLFEKEWTAKKAVRLIPWLLISLLR